MGPLDLFGSLVQVLTEKQNMETTVAVSLCCLTVWGDFARGGLSTSVPQRGDRQRSIKASQEYQPEVCACMHALHLSGCVCVGRPSGEWLSTVCAYRSLLKRLEFRWLGSLTRGQLQLVIKAAFRKRLSKHGLLFCFFKQVIVLNSRSSRVWSASLQYAHFYVEQHHVSWAGPCLHA